MGNQFMMYRREFLKDVAKVFTLKRIAIPAVVGLAEAIAGCLGNNGGEQKEEKRYDNIQQYRNEMIKEDFERMKENFKNRCGGRAAAI